MKKGVFSEKVPAPIGPFSQAILCNGEFLFVSGTIGMTLSHTLAEGGIRGQTQQILTNIAALLAESGYTLKDVVKVNVYLTEMNDFDEMNDVYSRFFGDPEPARTTIQVLGLPKGAIVEMDLIAVRDHR
jgi:2-iminobutanoate/2-iminopropanoate deaminase